jgi:long-chain fatty acid transport protein
MSEVKTLMKPVYRFNLVATAVATSLAAIPSLGEGFRSPTIGTYGLGISGGRSAYVDDASAVTHNPANLLDLNTWEVSAEPTIVHHEVKFTNPAGGTAQTKDPWKFLPQFFTAGKVNDSVALGLGITVPYGLSIDWEPQGALRYIAPQKVSLEAINVNPAIAIKLADGLNFGAGLDVMWSQIELRQYYPWQLLAPGLPDGLLSAKGDGFGYSGNAALTWEFTQNQRVAFTVRAPMDVDYDGHFTATGVPTSPTGVVRTSFGSGIKFPTIVGASYGIKVTEKVRIETDFEWLEFSRFDSLKLNVPLALPGVTTTIAENWKNTFTAGIGVDYRFAENWSVRGSYQYFESPTREYTFSPVVPDANQNAFTAGIEYRFGHHRLGAAYGYIAYDRQNIVANQVAGYIGTYDINVHLISANYRYSF